MSRWTAAGVGLFGVLIGGIAVLVGLAARTPPTAQETAPKAASDPLPVAGAAHEPVRAPEPALADAVAATRDAVVNLVTDRTLGAGVIVDATGVLITNHHVIADALVAPAASAELSGLRPTVTARFENGREVPALVLVADAEEDLAILRLQPALEDERFAAVTLGRSDELRVGQDVFAIGNPLGLSHTVSRGIVSAKDRTGILDNRALPVLQLDASINVGNSGGPLFSLDGRLVGLVTARRQQAQGIAFAVPVDHIRGFLRAVESDPARRSGAIGLTMDGRIPLSESARALGYGAGLVISGIEDEGPAAAAGLRADDTLVEVRGQRLDGMAASKPGELVAHVVATVRTMYEGERLELAVVRDDHVERVAVLIGKASPKRQALIDAEELLGVRLDPDAEGAVIKDARPDSPLAVLGAALSGARVVKLFGEDVDGLEGLGDRLARVRKVVRQQKRAVAVLVGLVRADGETLGQFHVLVR